MELWVPFCCAIMLIAMEILELTLFIGLMSVKSFGFCPGYRTLGGMSVSPRGFETSRTMLPKEYLAPDERRLLARFWQSASGFWQGPSAWLAWLLVGLLVATILLQLLTQYRLNFWNRDFFDAIERKDAAGLWKQALRLLPIGTASLILAIVSVWGRMTMQRKWREWLSNHLYDYWLERDHIVRLRFMSGEHQAPEYRIAEDARVATDLPIDLLLGLLSSVLVAVIFIGVLWRVGGDLVLDAFGTSVVVPGYLVFAVILYSVLLTAAMMLIARHLTRVMEDSKRTEAELRSVRNAPARGGRKDPGSGSPSGRPAGDRNGAGRGDPYLANVLLATDADDAGYSHELSADPYHRLAALYSQIHRGNDDPRRGRAGRRGLRHRPGCLQLDYRQLWSHLGVGRFGQPRVVAAAGAGPDRRAAKPRRGSRVQ
jgi:uncharacterized membrane protein